MEKVIKNITSSFENPILYPNCVNKPTLIFGDKQIGFSYKIYLGISPTIMNEIFSLMHQNQSN